MSKIFTLMLRLGVLLLVSAALLSGGCATVKKWAGYRTDEKKVRKRSPPRLSRKQS